MRNKWNQVVYNLLLAVRSKRTSRVLDHRTALEVNSMNANKPINSRRNSVRPDENLEDMLEFEEDDEIDPNTLL